MPVINLTCPFCNNSITIVDQRKIISETRIQFSDIFKEDIPRYDEYYVRVTAYACPNEECKKITLMIGTYSPNYYHPNKIGKLRQVWQLIPPSNAKPLPEYIPESIVKDYNESCLIKDLSPKASATLSRRCMQGIIRDFWKLPKPENGKFRKLAEEIKMIKDKIDVSTWEAIEAVRKIGNIGAHMEENVNLIIDIEPSEAQLLIELNEMLIKDWYINKHQREKSLASLKETAALKKEIIDESRSCNDDQ